MNGTELINRLKEMLSELDITATQFVWGDYSDADTEQLVEALGEFENVFSERVGSDYDEKQEVFHFPTHNVWIAIYGSYSSWDGVDFSNADFLEVEPVPSVVYDPKKKKK